MKKLSLLIIIFMLMLSLVSCGKGKEVNLSYKESEITVVLGDKVSVKPEINLGNKVKEYTLEYTLSSDIAKVDKKGMLTAEKVGTVTVTVTADDKKKSSASIKVIIREPYTSETYNWVTPQTDSLKLTQSYEGKDFIKDGIGVVTPVRYVDGDTSVFQASNGEAITIRYNGINTPESTYRIEPWGYAASKHSKDTFKEELEKGAKIVLQTEDMKNRTDSTGQRYLAWVWFVYPDGDSKLMNLQMAELGYAHVKSASGTQYEDYFMNAIYDISINKLRIYGEIDPKYDYSNTAKEMTIKEIREQFGTEEAVNNNTIEGFSSPLIKVTGIVVRKNGNTNAYIQQYDVDTNQYYGIYVYGGFNAISKLMLNAKVEVTGKIGYYYGALQITDVTSDSNIRLFSINHMDEIVVVKEKLEEINNIYNINKIGTLIEVGGLTVTGYNDSQNNSATTLYCQYTDSTGQTKRFNIRIDQNVSLIDPETGKQILSGEYFKGKTFKSIKGILCYYNGDTDNVEYANGHLQLALTDMADVVFED